MNCIKFNKFTLERSLFDGREDLSMTWHNRSSLRAFKKTWIDLINLLDSVNICSCNCKWNQVKKQFCESNNAKEIAE